MPFSLSRRIVAEALGSALLVAAVVGSGIMAQRLAGGNDALALLCNTVATGAALVVLISLFGPISGAHFNPVVSFVMWLNREQSAGDAVRYVTAQVGGGVCGSILAHLMFGLPAISLSKTERIGAGLWLAEVVATAGLLMTILIGRRVSPGNLPVLIGLYITSAYWFTASTSFANPAVTIARSLSDTFAGISPASIGWFIVAQICGAVAALVLCRWFLESPSAVAR